MRKHYASLTAFLSAWNDADRKQAIVEELASQGVFLDDLADQVGRDYDAFDLVCHIAFDQPPLTRRERADHVKKRDVFTKYGKKAREVLNALLDKYADGGIKSVESLDIFKVDPLSTSERRSKSSKPSAARQSTSRPSANSKPRSIRKQHDLWPTFRISSKPSRTSCARTPAPTAMRNASNN